MKRLTSIDFLRGIAIFFTLVFHFLFTNWDAFASPSIDGILEYGGVAFLIFAIIVVIFIHWRGFFLMISAVVNFYSMERALKKGKNVMVIWVKQIIAGIVLILIGKLWATFMPYWGPVEIWSRSSEVFTQPWTTFLEAWEGHKGMFYIIEAIESIGVMMIITSFLFLIFAIKKLRDNWLVKLSISFVIGIAVIVVTPYLQEVVVSNYAVNITTGEGFRTFTTWNIWEKIWRVPMNWFFGREAPLFPMIGSYFIGAGIGTILSQDKPKKKQLQWLYLVGGLLVVGAVLEFFLNVGIENLDPGFHIHPRWFALLSAGLQIITIVGTVLRIEFNQKINKEKWLKGTRFIRRFGVFALTAYFFSIGDMVIRFIFQAIFPNWDFISRYSLNWWWTIILVVILMASWHGVLYVWDRYAKGYMSWEFLVSLLRRPKGGHKRNWKDPINLKGILWDVEMISFVEPLEQPAKAVVEEPAK